MTSPRKTPKTWIEAGLKAVRKTGPDGLRAETLARVLGTTKGSFYWHFDDVPAFHDAVLNHWTAKEITRLETALDGQEGVTAQLRALGGLSASPLDTAVRAWAVQDPRARKAVAAYDKRLLAEISDRLRTLGATHPDFPGLVHAALITPNKSKSSAETLIDLLLVLK